MILIDGIETANVHAADRGLAYGDGVFRTFAVRRGTPSQWQRHYAKLAADCAAIGIPCPGQSLLRDELARACGDGAQEHAAKIIVTRGRGRRGYAYADDSEPTRIVSAAPRVAYPPEHAADGVRVRRCRLILSQQPALAGIKHLNRLENVLARAEWRDPAIAEGLLCDAALNVIGGTMTNVFIAKGGALATPDLSRCGVAGVTRDRVLDAARASGVACAITDIRWREVIEADEVILMNSLAGAWPVREIDGASMRTGPLVRAIQHWLSSSDEENA
jgi:4-amino-4-deoxychorismate lyase